MHSNGCSSTIGGLYASKLYAVCYMLPAICLNAIWGRSSSTKGDAGVDRGIGAAASFHRGMQRYVLQCFKCYILENVVFYMLENVICFKCYILCDSMLQISYAWKCYMFDNVMFQMLYPMGFNASNLICLKILYAMCFNASMLYPVFSFTPVPQKIATLI